MKKKIAIIGGGIAGLTAGYLLGRQHEVTLFEKTDRLGGNAYMIETPDGHKVDIAVAAFGKAGYPDFYALLDELGIKTEACANTFMSFHDMITKEGLYLTPSLKGGFKQGFHFLKPKTIKSLYNLFSGIKEAQKQLEKGSLEGQTVRECLASLPQFQGEAQMVLVCVLCLLSSMAYEEVLDAPAKFFIKKLKVNHDVISPKFLYSVRAVQGGTQAYVQAMIDHFSGNISFNSKIKTILRNKSGVTIVMKSGKKLKFDSVVFACNADQALALLDRPTKDEKRLLGVWRYKEGELIVHKDHSHFPSKDLIQAYTFLYSNLANQTATSVNGALWYEPYVSDDCDYICTQHPNFPIRKDLICFKTKLRTPIFDFDSVLTVPELPSLNGAQNTYYCGSHFGHGLHNDAISSAIAVAEKLGVKWERKKGSGLLGRIF